MCANPEQENKISEYINFLVQGNNPFEQSKKKEDDLKTMMLLVPSQKNFEDAQLQISKLKSEDPIIQWMIEQVMLRGFLTHQFAINGIQYHFGKEPIRTNENGNPAIQENILAEFRRITLHCICWDKKGKTWRLKSSLDSIDMRECNN